MEKKLLKSRILQDWNLKQLFENQKIKIFLNNLFLNHNIKRKQIIVTKLKLNKLQFTKLKQNNLLQI